jgi:hypothetical protein
MVILENVQKRSSFPMEIEQKNETLSNWVPWTIRSHVADSICSEGGMRLPRNLGDLVAEISLNC